MDYQLINSIFVGHDADQDASEAHGIAAGMLCIDSRVNAADWLHELFRDATELSTEEGECLQELFEQTRTVLSGDDEQFVFDLLLPADDEALPERLEALRAWCHGFLFGIGYAKYSSVWPGDCGEIMRDIVEFTKLDSEAGGEEDENAFTEIQEYLRSAVLLIRDQLAEDENRPSPH